MYETKHITEYEFCTTHFGFMTPEFKYHEVLTERPKLLEAFRRLLKRARNDLRRLPEISFYIQRDGEVGTTIFPTGQPIIYFPENLDRGSQNSNNYTVAHEIAHVLVERTAKETMKCEHGEDADCGECRGCKNWLNADDYLLDPHEQLADALVEKWGYKVPARKARARQEALRSQGLTGLTLRDLEPRRVWDGNVSDSDRHWAGIDTRQLHFAFYGSGSEQALAG